MSPNRGQKTGMKREEPNFVVVKEGFILGRVNTMRGLDFVFRAEDEHSLLNCDVRRRWMTYALRLPSQQSPGGMALPCGQVLGWPRKVQMR